MPVTSTREQVLRFSFPVAIDGWTDESATTFLNDYATHSTHETVNAFAGAVIGSLSADKREYALKYIAVETMLQNGLCPYLEHAMSNFSQTFVFDFDAATFATSLHICQDVVHQLCEDGLATLDDSVLHVTDEALRSHALPNIRAMKLMIEAATEDDAPAHQEFDAHGRRMARHILFLLESIRHAYTWSELTDAECRAIKQPCCACVQEIFGSQALEVISERIPWPFAFLAFLARYDGELPVWLR